MSSSPSAEISGISQRRIRKDPVTRRAEIVTAAAAIGLDEGLESVTLRRVADELGVRPGLISHYFPFAEDLVAEAFAEAAANDLDSLLPADHGGRTPTARLAAFLGTTGGEAYEAVSRLWVNARHLCRYRPVLADRVAVLEAEWQARLDRVIADGVAAGEFSTDDPALVSMQILVVIDGLSTHANIGTGHRPAAVARMAITTAERELGLPPGTLSPELSA
jgi:AcrR family transcriptional regulator